MTKPLTIATFPKNSREEIRVSLSEYAGRKLIDYRVYAPFAGPAQEMAATKAGVSLDINKVSELIAALVEAKAAAERLGWIGEGA